MSVDVSPVIVSNPMRRAVLRGLPLAPVHNQEAAAADVPRSEAADGANALPLLLLLSALLPLLVTAGCTEKASSLALRRSVASIPIMLLVGNIVIAVDGLCVLWLCEEREEDGEKRDSSSCWLFGTFASLPCVFFHVRVRLSYVRKSLPRLHQQLRADDSTWS